MGSPPFVGVVSLNCYFQFDLFLWCLHPSPIPPCLLSQCTTNRSADSAAFLPKFQPLEKLVMLYNCQTTTGMS